MSGTIPPGGSAVLSNSPGYVAGNWYQPTYGVSVAAGSALANGSIKLLPFPVYETITISDLGARVTTLAAGGNIQLAIYAMDTATKNPTGTALAATGNISTAATGIVEADISGANVQLQRAWHYMAVNSDNATVVMQTMNTANIWAGAMIGSATHADISSSTFAGMHLSFAQAFGTWPDLTGQTFVRAVTQTTGLVHFKVASVP